MPSLPARALLGFVAAALSVLTFHQGMIELLHLAGITGPGWSMRPIAPFGIPSLVDLCFWGGLYGLVFGAAAPALRPLWLWGIGLGITAVVVGWLVVAPLKSLPLGYGWHARGIVLSLLIDGSWGLGVGLILPVLMRDRSRRRRRFARRSASAG